LWFKIIGVGFSELILFDFSAVFNPAFFGAVVLIFFSDILDLWFHFPLLRIQIR